MIIASAAMAIGLVACDKGGGGNNGAWNNNVYAPNSCLNSGGANRYQFVNGTCRDVQQNQTVPQNYCANSQFGNTYDPQCNYYGGSNFFPGSVNGGNACSIYNDGFQQWYPVYMPQAGGYVCVSSNTFNYIGGYYGGFPSYYQNYGYLQGCYPGVSSCNCQGFGGSLGWYSAGISVGICF